MADSPVPDFHFAATCIGSVPFADVEKTCSDILSLFPVMPFWPQFVNRSFLEDMSAQYTEGLPLLTVDEKRRSIVFSGAADSESALTLFYEHFLAGDLEYFAVSRAYAPGLHMLLDLMDHGNIAEGPFIKGQTVGPITFASGIRDGAGKALIHNPELSEAMVNGLSAKALWQIRALEKTGRRPVLFLDEPSLTGFGSAFSAIQRREVIAILSTTIRYLKENSNALIGIHCCGNTDWPMIMASGPDIINFDAFSHMEHFLLYPEETAAFISGGGTIAWGIVPTAGFSGAETVQDLCLRLKSGLEKTAGWGIDPGLVSRRSMLTPACGMGTMGRNEAAKGMKLLSSVYERFRFTV